MTLEEFNYQTRRVHTHSSERVCSTEQWAGYCCCLFGELLGSLLWLRRRLVRQTLLYAPVDFSLGGVLDFTSKPPRPIVDLYAVQNQTRLIVHQQQQHQQHHARHDGVCENKGEKRWRKEGEKKVTEKPPNIWWFSIGRMIFHLNSDDIRFLIHISEYVCMKTSAQSNFSFIAAQSDAKRRREWKTIIHFMLNDAMVDAERLKSRFR